MSRERITRELQEKLMACPERQSYFETWGRLNHASAYLSKEWPYGAQNTRDAIREIHNCAWLIKADVGEFDANFFRELLIDRQLQWELEHPATVKLNQSIRDVTAGRKKIRVKHPEGKP